MRRYQSYMPYRLPLTSPLPRQVVERIPLEKLSRKDCNKLLKERGFFRKESREDPVPEEYQEGPYGTQHQEL